VYCHHVVRAVNLLELTQHKLLRAASAATQRQQWQVVSVLSVRTHPKQCSFQAVTGQAGLKHDMCGWVQECGT
jgi:hypothetical protein